jgi:hypothetical protein
VRRRLPGHCYHKETPVILKQFPQASPFFHKTEIESTSRQVAVAYINVLQSCRGVVERKEAMRQA